MWKWYQPSLIAKELKITSRAAQDLVGELGLRARSRICDSCSGSWASRTSSSRMQRRWGSAPRRAPLSNAKVAAAVKHPHAEKELV
jgi:hypothetical protein